MKCKSFNNDISVIKWYILQNLNMQIRSAIAENIVLRNISANNSNNLVIMMNKPMFSRSQIILKVFLFHFTNTMNRYMIITSDFRLFFTEYIYFSEAANGYHRKIMDHICPTINAYKWLKLVSILSLWSAKVLIMIFLLQNDISYKIWICKLGPPLPKILVFFFNISANNLNNLVIKVYKPCCQDHKLS